MNNKSGSEQKCDECDYPYSADPTDGGTICIRCLKEKRDHLQKIVEEHESACRQFHKELDAVGIPTGHEVDRGKIVEVVEYPVNERIKLLVSQLADQTAMHDHYMKLSAERFDEIEKLKVQLADQKAENERLKKAEKSLDDQLAIQLAEPSIKTDAYMAGLANGMLLAKANFGGDYNPISYKDSRLAEQKELTTAWKKKYEEYSTYCIALSDCEKEKAEQTERVRVMREALGKAYEWACKYPLQGEPSTADMDASDDVRFACQQALTQESLGKGK